MVLICSIFSNREERSLLEKVITKTMILLIALRLYENGKDCSYYASHTIYCISRGTQVEHLFQLVQKRLVPMAT